MLQSYGNHALPANFCRVGKSPLSTWSPSHIVGKLAIDYPTGMDRSDGTQPDALPSPLPHALPNAPLPLDRPHDMKTVAKSQFEAWAGSYDRSILNIFLFQPSYRMFLQELQGWRGSSSEPFDLLDIGCGTGTFDAMLAGSPLPARIVGLDYANAMCQIASDKAHQAGVANRLRYVNGDSQHLPFADGSFDVVTCSNSFHHYPHQQQVVFEMRRVLRPGGRLMLIDGFCNNIIGWVAYDIIVGHFEKKVHHAPWATIHQYFVNAGFRDIYRRKFGFWAPALLTVGTA